MVVVGWLDVVLAVELVLLVQLRVREVRAVVALPAIGDGVHMGVVLQGRGEVASSALEQRAWYALEELVVRLRCRGLVSVLAKGVVGGWAAMAQPNLVVVGGMVV